MNPDGTKKWEFLTGGYVNSSAAIGTDGTIYVGNYDGNLYAINPDGTKKWAFSTGGHIKSSAAVDADGTIYVGSCDGNLYAVNRDGTKKWDFPLGNYDSSSLPLGYSESKGTSSPAIGTDGTVYIGGFDGKLYAIATTGKGLANSAWPMFHHDATHTGRAP